MSDDARLVATADQLAQLDPLLAAAPWIALDTESNAMHVYRERVCLMQLNLGGTLVVIDPFEIPREALAEGLLAQRLADPTVPVLVHGGEYDVVCLDRDYGIRIQGLWDSQQAASLLGLPATGYGAVVESLLGVRLDKAYQEHDWGLRPIAPEPLAYAIDDVRHLPGIVAALRERIAAADLEEELAIANQAVQDTRSRGGAVYDPADLWRMKGVGHLRQDALPILAALLTWRDGIAQAENRPPGRVANNDLLLAIARKAPVNFGMLHSLQLRQNFLARLGESLIACIKAAKEQPPSVPPAPFRREILPEERYHEDRLKDWRRKEAEKRSVTLQVVLPAKALEHLKRYGASDDLSGVPQLGPKRIARYGEQLRKLAGAPRGTTTPPAESLPA
jgi:ribonuclease D